MAAEALATARPAPPARTLRARGERAITLLELAVVIGIVGVLVAVAVDRLLALRADAERAAVRQVLGALRAGLSLEMLALILDGRDAELAALGERNPVESLREPPPNYAGAFDAPDPASIAPGRWYFDRARARLVYRLRYPEAFHSDLPGPPRAPFRVRFSYADRNENGRFDPGVDDLGGLRVEAAEKFTWMGLKSHGF